MNPSEISHNWKFIDNFVFDFVRKHLSLSALIDLIKLNVSIKINGPIDSILK